MRGNGGGTRDVLRAVFPCFMKAGDAPHVANVAAYRLPPDEERGRPEGYLERQVCRWSAQWEGNKTAELPEIDELLARLARAVPESAGATVVHGDYRLGNMALDSEDPGRVVAVFDWEMATLGAPLADLGYMLIYWIEAGDGPAAEHLEPRITAPALDLQSFYIADLLESFKGATPQLLRHQHATFTPGSGPLTDSCWISSTVRRLIIALTWQGDADRNQLTCALETPDGTLLELHERTSASARRRILTIPLPAYHRGRLVDTAGRWRLHVTGSVKQEVPCQIFWIADDYRIHLRLDWPRRLYRVGDTLRLNAQLVKDKEALASKKIHKAMLNVTAPVVNFQRFFKEYKVSPAKLQSAKKQMKWPGLHTDSAVRLFVLSQDKRAVTQVTKTSRRRVPLKSERGALTGSFSFKKTGVHRLTLEVDTVDRLGEHVVRTTTNSVYVRPKK